jgi:hypothetical protein
VWRPANNFLKAVESESQFFRAKAADKPSKIVKLFAGRDTSTSEKIDIERTKKTAEHVFDVLGGALVSGMIYLGDRMGLYQALNGVGAVTSEDLARKTRLHERWIREWLYGQAAANLIDYKGEGRFELSRESALVLANWSAPRKLCRNEVESVAC